MRLDINLASQPYEDARQFWMRWGTGVGALALLTLVLLMLDTTGWINARRDRAAIAEKRVLIADRDRLRDNAAEFLNRPQNRNTRDESQFLNGLIERKAFSWTRVLENLERVMPPRVHLVSISPKLDEDNQLELDMMVAGDSRERAIELTRHMEESKRFSDTRIKSEHYAQSQTGDNEQFEIAAIYLPEPFVGADAAPANNKLVKTVKPAGDSKPQTKPQAKKDASAKSQSAKGGKP